MNITSTVIHNQCCEIIEEIVTAGMFASFDLVLSVLLSRYSAPTFEHLQVGNIHANPVLNLLLEFQNRVVGYINTYFGTRSIVSIFDLEIEILNFIISLNVPTLPSLNHQFKARSMDPNEIDLEMNDDDYSVSKSVTDFGSFGLGKFRSIPVVRSMFPHLVDDASLLCTADILGFLQEYSALSNMEVSCDNFAIYVEDAVQCKLAEVGIVLRGNMATELQLINVVDKANNSYLEEYRKREMALVQQKRLKLQQTDGGGGLLFTVKQTLKPSHALRHTPDDIGKLVNISTNHAVVSQFVENCKNRIVQDSQQAGTELVFSPTHSKTMTAVRNILLTMTASGHDEGAVEGHTADSTALDDLDNNHHDNGNNNSKSTSKKQKRKRRARSNVDAPCSSAGDSWSSADLVVQTVLTDYVMLHIGGSKYKNKHITLNEDTSATHTRNAPNVQHFTQNDYNNCTNDNDQDNVNNNDNDQDNDNDNSNSNEAEAPQAIISLNDTHTDNFHLREEVEESKDVELNDSPPVLSPPQSQSQSSCMQQTHALASVDSCQDISRHCHRSSVCAAAGAVLLEFQSSLISGISYDGKLVRGPSRLIGCSDKNIMFIDNTKLTRLLPVMPWSSTPGPFTPQDTGRWGEALVYHYLLQTLKTDGQPSHNSAPSVQWVNQHEESRASYDIVVSNHTSSRYIEVKSSRHADCNVFELSLWEWQFATALPRVQYHIYRVFSAGDSGKVCMAVITNVLQAVADKEVRLCLAV